MLNQYSNNRYQSSIKKNKNIVTVSSANSKKNYINNYVKNNLNFIYPLQCPMSNIIGFKLTNYSIPFDWYIINSTNNELKWSSFFKKCEQKIIKEYSTYIPNGTYNIDKLSDIIVKYMTNEEINNYLISYWVNSVDSSLIKISRNKQIESLDNTPIFDIEFRQNKNIEIIHYSPTNYSCNIPIDTDIIITFNNNIKFHNDFIDDIILDKDIYMFKNINSIENKIRLYYYHIEIPISIYIKDNTLVIHPYFCLNYSTSYILKIDDNTIIDIYNNTFRGLNHYCFNTTIDTCLNIIHYNPNQHSIENSIDKSIELTFTKNLEFTYYFKQLTNFIDNKYEYKITDNTNKISLFSEYGVRIPIIIDIASKKLILKPKYKLEYNTNYYVTITCGEIKIYGTDDCTCSKYNVGGYLCGYELPETFCNNEFSMTQCGYQMPGYDCSVKYPGYLCDDEILPGYILNGVEYSYGGGYNNEECDGTNLPGYICNGYKLENYGENHFILKENIYEFKTIECKQNTNIYSYRLEKIINNHITEEVFNKYDIGGPGFVFWFNKNWNGWNNSFNNFFESNILINTDFLAVGRYTLFTECYNNGYLYYNGERFVSDLNENERYGIWKLDTELYLYIFWWNCQARVWQIGRTFKNNKIQKIDILQCKDIEELNISKVYPKHKEKWVNPFNKKFNKYNYIEMVVNNQSIKVKMPPKITNMPWALSIDEHSSDIDKSKKSFLNKKTKTFSDKITTETYYLNPIPNNKGELETNHILFKGLNNIEYDGIKYTKKNINLDESYPIRYINKYDKSKNRLTIEATWNNILEKSYNTTVYPPYFRFEKTKMNSVLLKTLGLSKYNSIKMEYYIIYSGIDVNTLFIANNIDNIERLITKQIEKLVYRYQEQTNIIVQINRDTNIIYIKSIHNQNINIDITNIIQALYKIEYFMNKNIVFNSNNINYDYNPDESYMKLFIGNNTPLPLGEKIIYLHINFLERYEENNSNKEIIIPININCDYNQSISSLEQSISDIYYLDKEKTINNISIKIMYPNSTEVIISQGGLNSYFTFELIEQVKVKQKSSVEMLNELKIELIKQSMNMKKEISMNDIYGL